MSLLDKINYSQSELDDKNIKSLKNNKVQDQINQNDIKQNNQEIKLLKKQLKESNDLNNKNIQEINELKELIQNYKLHFDNLKKSYEDNINKLKAQVDFEKEINEKYLIKLVKSNENLKSDIKNYNEKQHNDNNKLISLINNNKEFSDEISSNTKEINILKEYINQNNQDITSLINGLKEETLSSNEDIKKQLLTQEKDDFSIKEDNVKKFINTNFEEINTKITENRDIYEGKISKILENINEKSSYQKNDVDEIKSLINNNKKELNDFEERLLNLYSNSSNQKLIDNLFEKINELNIDKVNNTSNFIKIEIFNKISDELRCGNYVNLSAYEKIKQLNLFDEIFYKEMYDYNLDIDPLLHFIYKGYEENKKPSSLFDPIEYKKSHVNIKNSNLNPLVYFVTNGIKEGNIKINKDIDEINHINKQDIDKDIEKFEIRGVKKTKRKPRLIVSLTSTHEYMDELHYTLYSLLNQQLKADKVILWLNKNEFPNEELDLSKNILKLKQNGLSIRFCENYEQYSTIIPVLKTYPNDIIITANDNIYYPQNWLKILYEDYKKNPNTIIAHKSKIILLDDQNNIEKCNKWIINTNQEEASYNYIPNIKAGVLYPPKILHEDLINTDKFNEYSENLDVYLWAMTIINNKKIKQANNKEKYEITYVNPLRESQLINKIKNSYKNKQKDKDTSIKNIVNRYPQIINIIK